MAGPRPASPSALNRRLTFLLSVAAGAAIANLYWVQPLLSFIAEDLDAPTATAGWLVTATQIGYAVGVLLLVPLGDILDRRRFVPVMFLASAVALLLCALAPSIGVLLVALGVLGVTTISGQVLTPLAGDLAGDAHRGRIVGVVIDVAFQTQALLNRARLFALSNEARSRLNTALSVSNFVGAAAGSAAASTLWSVGGWPAVSVSGVGLCCLALTVWALGRRGPLVVGLAGPDGAAPGRAT
ncbi:MFS transporter [Micromonospora sp. NPDC049102]|uniref:MFS transporter n=1 Tax=Micromonospora sp. NPDC049102 TaxID=3364265 RepID=UPI00371A645E